MTAGGSPSPRTDRRHPAALSDDDLLRECEVRFSRRSGPGGQHRNKVETAVVVTHRQTGCSAQASERRSQAENRREALFRLRVNLAIEVRTAPGDRPSPSSLWLSRISKSGRILVSPSHADYPSLLADALDSLCHHTWDYQLAARTLGTTSSQLRKLLKAEPRAFDYVNARRESVGLPGLA
jgi:hypothetical protein